MFRVLGRIMRKEFIQTFRDKKMFGIIIAAPLLQTILFGYAVNMDLTAQPIVVADEDHSSESRALITAIAAHDGFRLIGETAHPEAATQAVVRGQAGLALIIPRGYAKASERQSGELSVILDGSDSNTALRAGQEITQIINNRVTTALQARIRTRVASLGISADRQFPQIEIVSRAWYNPQMRSAVFTVPGVLGLVLLVITMMLTSLGLTREKEIGTLEQIMVTPIKPWQLILGKCLPFAILGMADIVLIVCVASLIFSIPPLGSLLALALACVLFLLVALGLGLFISTVSATQQQAMLTAFFFIFPMINLSGFVFPIDSMPPFAQWLTAFNPVRYFLDLVRGIIVKGASLEDLAYQALVLAAMAFFVLLGSSLRFRKRLG